MRNAATFPRWATRLGAACALVASGALYAATVDPALPAYEPLPASVRPGASYVRPDGTVHIVLGNRGMGVAIERLDALFSQTHPGVRFSVRYNEKGNTLPLAALMHGTSLFCPLAREINDAENAAYAQVVGAAPVIVNIAHGTLTAPRMTAGLAIYVHKDNPVRRLTMDQLARIFTSGALGGDITRWGQLGATGEWATRPIRTYGTPEYSGYGFFMVQRKWQGRPLAPGYEAFDLAAQIVGRVGQDAYGIGFAGQGFLTPQTHLVALAQSDSAAYLEGNEEDVTHGRYALDRNVGLALRAAPGEPLDPLALEYMRLVLSREGQSLIAAEADGFVPLDAAQVAAERAKLGIVR